MLWSLWWEESVQVSWTCNLGAPVDFFIRTMYSYEHIWLWCRLLTYLLTWWLVLPRPGWGHQREEDIWFWERSSLSCPVTVLVCVEAKCVGTTLWHLYAVLKLAMLGRLFTSTGILFVICIYMYVCRRFQWKTEAQAIFLVPFARSSFKRKFIICFVRLFPKKQT